MQVLRLLSRVAGLVSIVVGHGRRRLARGHVRSHLWEDIGAVTLIRASLRSTRRLVGAGPVHDLRLAARPVLVDHEAVLVVAARLVSATALLEGRFGPS